MAREMKESGIEWIGEIPKNWKVTKVKHYIKIENGKDPKTEGDIPVYGSGSESFKTCGEYKIGPTVLLGRKGTLNIPHYIEGKYWNVDTAFNTIPNTKISLRYFYFLACCFDYKYYISQTTLPGMTQTNYGNIYIPFPEKKEQQQIAEYLDKKVADIDLIIEKTKTTIEDYKKYKQSIITEAVTKGLNPNVEMKDSGIEWIGQIPKHWTLKKFRNILIERNEKNIPIKTFERLSLSIDKGVTLYSEKTTNLDRFKEDVSQYKIAHINDLVLNSMNMIVGAVGVSKYFGCVSPVYYTYYDKIKNSPTPKFCNYLFSSKTIKKVLFSLGRGIMAIDRGDDKINTCRLKISRDDLRSLIFPIPSLEEQQQIVEYLDKKITEIDNLIVKKESLISEMEEYKKSLIYECVTGKKEIV